MSDLLLSVSHTYYVLIFISGKPLREPRNCKAAYFSLGVLTLTVTQDIGIMVSVTTQAMCFESQGVPFSSTN